MAGATDSDHMTMVLNLNISYSKPAKPRIEIYDLKNKESQSIFHEITTKSELSKCFENNSSFKSQISQWEKKFKSCIAQSFNKIRITDKKKKTESQKLIEERSRLRNNLKMVQNEDGIEKINEQIHSVEQKLSNLLAQENTQKVKDNLTVMSSIDGSFNSNGFWKIKKKIFPKNGKALPVSKVNTVGRLISNPAELKQLYSQTYTHRLRHRPIKPGLELIKNLKEELCFKRLELVKLVPTQEWCNDDLLKVLKSLKLNKSRDPHSLINEIFKPGVIGTDLQKSLLMMFNRVKKEFDIPELMQFANIISIYKGKGVKNDLQSDRGIFIINLFKSMMMKMIYNDEYWTIDNNMSDSNIGARKRRSIRNHIFILNGIINEAIKSKKSVDIQILDYRQCFDSMLMEECINDMYECGVKNPNLALIYEANKVNKVAIMTPNGLTERKTIKNIVMQGEVFGPLECSITVDTFGKECLARKEYLYSYKGVEVPPLAMVDDLACISTCGLDTVKMNSYINAKTNLKKLQFGPDKCHKMHIGKKTDYCPDLLIDSWKIETKSEVETNSVEQIDIFEGDVEMEESCEEKYLGDLIASDGSNKKNVAARKGRGFGIIDKVMAMLEEISFGPNFFEVALLLRESLFLSSILLNCEAWYGLSMSEVEQLEIVDQALLKKILDAPSSTTNAGLYLEMGCLPIRFIIKSRRIMFLHYILSEDDNSLMLKFFKAQLENPSPGDWAVQVQEDLEEIDMNITMEEIKAVSEDSFRRKVKAAIQKAAFKWLTQEKATKSKIKNIQYPKFQLQEYFQGNTLDTREKKLLFQLRTRMVDIKLNFKNSHTDLSCPLCAQVDDTQEHVLMCSALMKDTYFVASGTVKYSDIFHSDVTKQAAVSRIFQTLWNSRRKIIKKGSHPPDVAHVI